MDEDSEAANIKQELIVKINGNIIGTVQKSRKFFLAFQFGADWTENSYDSPVNFSTLSDLSENNWSRSTDPLGMKIILIWSFHSTNRL